VVITCVSLVGTITGQIFFGFAGDWMGRRMAYLLALGITTFSAVGSAMSFGTSTQAVIGTLCCFRCLLGIGIGGG